MACGRSQPAADDRRPDRHRQRRPRRDHARLDDPSPRFGDRTRDRATRRQPLSRPSPFRQRRSALAQRAVGRRVRARDRRRDLSRPDHRPLSLRPLRAGQRSHRQQRSGGLRRTQQRLAVDDRPARPVLARCRGCASVQHGRTGARCLRRMERRSRSRRRPAGRRPLCLPRDDGCGRPRPLRCMGADTRIRADLDTAQCRRRLGALQHRPLGLGAALGMDLGRRSPVGLCPLSLRPLGLSPKRLGLGAGHLRRPSGLRAGAGGVDGWPSAQCFHFDRWRRRSAGRLVPARAPRGLRAEL